MSTESERDIEKAYTTSKFVAKLRRPADALESVHCRSFCCGMHDCRTPKVRLGPEHESQVLRRACPVLERVPAVGIAPNAMTQVACCPTLEFRSQTN